MKQQWDDYFEGDIPHEIMSKEISLSSKDLVLFG